MGHALTHRLLSFATLITVFMLCIPPQLPKVTAEMICLLQFLALADVFLASTLLPAYTVAAFAKRFACLALTAPPAGAMCAIAFIHNLVRWVGRVHHGMDVQSPQINAG